MSDNYCIFRAAKLKTLQDVTLVLKEQHRAEDYDSVRADKELSGNNSYSGNYEAAMKNFENLLPQKVRKNAVLGLNFLVSTSQEFTNEVEEYLYYDKARRFIESHFGKIVGWAIHRDETSTHMQVVTVPLVDGKLNARKLIGGDKHRMQQIQTDFWAEVGNQFGLIRGKDAAETHAKHKEVEQLHREEQAEIDRQKSDLEAREKRLSEAEKSIPERLSAVVDKETRLNEKEAEINRKGEIISEVVKTVKENSLGVYEELEEHKKNKFHLPFNMDKFLENVEKALTGAWALVKKLTDKNQKLEKDLEDSKKRLENWRNSSADELEKLAADYRAAGVDSWTEFEIKQQQKKRHYNGFSMSD